MIGIDLIPFLFAFMSIFLGSFIKGAIGFGLPIIATPVMIIFLPLADVIALQIIPICAANIQQCWLTRSHSYILSIFWPMITANITILFFGSYVLLQLNIGMLMPIIGLLIIMQAVISDIPIFNLSKFANIKPLILIAGVISGVLGSISSFYAFPSVQLMVAMRLKRMEFIFIVGFLLSTGFIALWLGIALNGHHVTAMLPLSLFLTIPTAIGMILGNKISHILSSGWFRTLVRCMLALTGILLICKSIIL